MKKTTKFGVMALLISAAALTAGAQDSYNSLHPEFSSDLSFSSGIQNLNGNTEVKEIPGVSSEYDADVNFTLKGSFERASEWAVEKENGIESKSGVGYEVGFGVDMSALYAATSSGSSYSSSSDTNYYSLIQPMIDWYEANRARYNLPATPFAELSAAQPWPTTNYGNTTGRYQFIHGTTVERADDVNWTSAVSADALCLYNDIKYAINKAIDYLYTDPATAAFATGNISQIAYGDMTDAQKRYAELKMKAKREFSAVASGKVTAKTLKDAVKTSYIKVTNLAGVADMRLDAAGQRLTVGEALYSDIAGQSTTGAALAFNLKNGLVPGLEFSVAAGIAGGEKQEVENYDTDKLDYYAGMSGELAAKAAARWLGYIEPIASNVSVYGGVVASDLLVAKMNGAANVGLSVEHFGFVSCAANLEGMVLNYKDRTDDDAKYTLAYSGYFNGKVTCAGVDLFAEGAYKSKAFSHATYNAVEDRFYGYSLESDYYIANLKDAIFVNAGLEFNPQYFIGYNVVSAKASVSGLLYDYAIASKGLDLTATLSFKDLIKLPVKFYGTASYYENSLVAEYADMATLPERTVVDFTTLKAGVTFSPVSQLELGVEFVSAPSLSRRNSERLTSVLLNGTIKF